ncbi:MAG: CARDB domain-containing protein, partial [Candidatus Bathyarchaeia archaeon]
WLVKTDAYGNMEWNRTYGTDKTERAYSAQQTSDGGYILAGEGPYYYENIWLVKTDVNGNMEWNATYGESNWEAQCVQQTSDGGYIVAGYVRYPYETPPSDFLLMKVGVKHDVAVTSVQPSKSVVAQNHSLSINVTVENQGDSTETFNVTAYASKTAIDTLTNITLTSRNSTTITFDWNTTGFIEGVYTLSATVTPVPDEIETADNTYVDGLVIVGAGPPGNLIWINPPLTDNLQEGNTLVVDLMINITDPDPINSPPDGLYGFEYKLKWNATVLEAESIRYHSPWPPANSWVVRNETGVAPDGRHYHWLAISAFGGATPFTGVTSLCTYTFHVKWQPKEPAPDFCGLLDIYDDKLVDDQAKLIDHTTYDGQYRIPSKIPVHDVAITGITLSKTIVGQGLSMHINVTVANQGNVPDSFNVTAYCNTTPIATQAIILANGNFTTITFLWNTTGFAKGVYTISANATIVQGETDTADNSYTDGTVRVNMVGDVAPEFGLVDIVDVVTAAIAYGTQRGDPNYNPNADINGDGIIDIVDIVITAIHFGETDH